MTPVQIRTKINQTKNELAHHEGEAVTQQSAIDADRKKLGKVLDCKPGKEKAAIQKLKKRIETSQAKVEELLDEAEAIRDQVQEGEDE